MKNFFKFKFSASKLTKMSKIKNKIFNIFILFISILVLTCASTYYIYMGSTESIGSFRHQTFFPKNFPSSKTQPLVLIETSQMKKWNFSATWPEISLKDLIDPVSPYIFEDMFHNFGLFQFFCFQLHTYPYCCYYHYLHFKAELNRKVFYF